jgi:hypothetical protein
MALFELRCEADGQRWNCDARNAAEAIGIFGLQRGLLFTYHQRPGASRYSLGAARTAVEGSGEALAPVWGTTV